MVDVKIKLSALWVALFFNSIYGDVLRLYDTEAISHFIESMTPEMLLISAITMEIPIVMGAMSLLLKEKANRKINMIIGIYYVCYGLLFLYSSFFMAAYEIVLASALFMFAVLIVIYAWKWPKQGD